MYPLLRHGDRLPTVAVVQVLLNRKMKQSDYVNVDGAFGPKTAEAVSAFQRSRNLGPDGVVGLQTWRALSESEPCGVLDTTDVADHQDHAWMVAPMQRAGGNPLVNYGMSNGAEVVCRRIAAKATPRSVALLRFLGHGGPGVQGLTYGRYGNASGTGNRLERREGSAVIAADNIWQRAELLQSLCGIFSAFGSAELHGCHTGKGAEGQWLLQTLANLWGVPVTAGTHSQRGAGVKLYRFEGPTVTAFPQGGDLKGWASKLKADGVQAVSVSR